MFSWLGRLFNNTPTNAFTYKYQELSGTKYPVCDVEFILNNKNASYFMVIDSGADISLIPKSVGEQLGFKRTQLKYLGGVGGRAGYYINYANVKIANKKFTAPFAWMTNDDLPMLLGRQGIFSKFNICFKEKRGEVEFISS